MTENLNDLIRQAAGYEPGPASKESTPHDKAAELRREADRLDLQAEEASRDEMNAAIRDAAKRWSQSSVEEKPPESSDRPQGTSNAGEGLPEPEDAVYEQTEYGLMRVHRIGGGEHIEVGPIDPNPHNKETKE